MQKIKACLVYAICLSFLILTGCSPTGSGESRDPSASTIGMSDSSGSTLTCKANDFSKRIEFSYPQIGGDKAGNDPLYDIISKKFNVVIHYLPLTWDDWQEKTNTWIASGAMPDVLWWDLRAPQYAKFAQWCKDGVFKEIPDLGENYPNLDRVLKLMPETDKFKVDGKSYMIPHYDDDPAMQNVGGVSFYYRKDWAIKLGLDKDVFTFEDFKNYVKACIEKNPGGNGTGRTLGVVGPSWTVPDHVFMYEVSPYFASYVKKDGKYVWGASLPETLEGLKISQQLYREGIINKDFYTVNDKEGDAQFLSGRAAVLVETLNAGLLKEYRDTFMYENPGLDADKAVAPMKVLGPYGKTAIQEDYGFWSVSSFNPNLSDEKMQRILAIMDWCCTDEAQELSNYGIRGKDWDIVNGKFTQLWPENTDGQPTRPNYMDISYIYFNMGTNGGQFSFLKDISMSDAVKQDITDWIDWRKSAPQSVLKIDPELDFLITVNKSKYGSSAQDIKDEAKRLIISSDDIEKDWNKWLESMKPKVDPILTEINQNLS